MSQSYAEQPWFVPHRGGKRGWSPETWQGWLLWGARWPLLVIGLTLIGLDRTYFGVIAAVAILVVYFVTFYIAAETRGKRPDAPPEQPAEPGAESTTEV